MGLYICNYCGYSLKFNLIDLSRDKCMKCKIGRFVNFSIKNDK